MRAGRGLRAGGIPILSVEHDPLKLLGQAAEFIFVLGFLDAVQTEMSCLSGGVASLVAPCPSCLNRFACALATLFRSEFIGSCRTADLAASASQRYGVVVQEPVQESI